jgi:hypothetical protein
VYDSLFSNIDFNGNVKCRIENFRWENKLEAAMNG